MEIKYRVMRKITSGGCSSCSDEDEWMNVATTYDPIGFSAEHPGWIVRYEQVILGKRIIYNSK